MLGKTSQIQLSVRSLRPRIHYIHQPGPPGAPVLLLLHGHSSCVLECTDLLPHLAGQAEVFAFDQPCCGESSDVKRADVLQEYGDWAPYSALYFLRDLTDRFVRDVVVPKVGGRKVRVAGGSLGGNLALLLAERRPRYAWLERAFAWSPGSAWAPGIDRSQGARVARQRAAQDWSDKGALRTFLHITFCQKALPPPLSSYPQPWYWYYDCWGEPRGEGECTGKGEGGCPRCRGRRPKLHYGGSPLGTSHEYPGMGAKKVAAIEASLERLSATITPDRAAWHWQIAAEQLEFSHLQVLEGGRVRLADLQCDTVFMAGQEDRHFPAALFQDTQKLFQVAADTHRKSAIRVDSHWFSFAGHSLHNERPADLAKVLAEPSP